MMTAATLNEVFNQREVEIRISIEKNYQHICVRYSKDGARIEAEENFYYSDLAEIAEKYKQDVDMFQVSDLIKVLFNRVVSLSKGSETLIKALPAPEGEWEDDTDGMGNPLTGVSND